MLIFTSGLPHRHIVRSLRHEIAAKRSYGWYGVIIFPGTRSDTSNRFLFLLSPTVPILRPIFVPSLPVYYRLHYRLRMIQYSYIPHESRYANEAKVYRMVACSILCKYIMIAVSHLLNCYKSLTGQRYSRNEYHREIRKCTAAPLSHVFTAFI